MKRYRIVAIISIERLYRNYGRSSRHSRIVLKEVLMLTLKPKILIDFQLITTTYQ
jgi:hypothetical protein